ncbi:unnamed protein product [Durusdinium trenchii]|uniref:Guanylate cyclase domain-containing protein n=2 Tax=Durusdinium trenchii TaxID=1381693 RepID=A0ABP0N9H8_9DINO
MTPPLAETLLSHPVPRTFEDGKLTFHRSPEGSATRQKTGSIERLERFERARDRSASRSSLGKKASLAASLASEEGVRPIRSQSAPSMFFHSDTQPESLYRFPSAPQNKRGAKSSTDLIEVQPLTAAELNHLGRILQGQFGHLEDEVMLAPPTPAHGNRTPTPAPEDFPDLHADGKKQGFIHRLADSQCFVSGFMILTIFALFAPDLDLLLGTVQSQHSLSLVMTFACFLFVVEIIVQSIGKEGYLFRAYFWLDVIALISLLPDTWLFREVFESNQAFVAGRSSRLARLLRIASRSSKATRLNRLTRIVRVAALMPRLGKICAKRVKVNDTNRVLDKKLRRVFNFIDTDMDGLIPHMAVLSVISKLKAGGNADESTALVNMLKSKVVNTLGIARKTQKSEPATIPAMLSEGTRSKTSIDFGARSKTSLEFLAESPCQSQSSAAFAESPRDAKPVSESNHTSPGRRKFPLSKSHTSNFQAKMKSMAFAASSTSRQSPEQLEEDSEELIEFADFRKLMLADEWVASRLRSACEQQLKQASNMKNLTSRHAEHVAVKVALGVLLLLFVLNLIEPSLNNSSPLRGLRFCDKFVRSEFNLTAEAEVPELVKEQVEVWLDAVGKSIGTRSLLYLDLDRKVYCSEIPGHTGGPCNNASHFLGSRRELLVLDGDLRNTGVRQSDLLLLRVPDFSDEEVSQEELEQRTTAVAVLFDRVHSSVEAWMSILTTSAVIFIILSGIVLLTRDLTFLSHHLLRPLRDLADEMESIAQLQLAGVSNTEEEEVGGEKETSEVQLIRRTFGNMKKAVRSWGKYVPWPVVQTLLRAGDEAKLEVREREVTMFFSDIANFTTIVEGWEPEECLILLSRYFNDMSKVIDDHGGVVLEFIGDAIQCIYGAPLYNDNHPVVAVEAALRMLSALRRIKEWCAEKGLPEVSIRCGIHTGNVLVGNMGFRSRMKYGIVGEESTIAGRLEELNKTYKTRILISESTYTNLGPHDYFIRPVDFVHLRQASTEKEACSELIYEVMPMRAKRPSMVNRIISLHQEAIYEYRRLEFANAARKFEQVNSILADINDGEDVPSSLMVERCTTLTRVPPPQDWDGTWDSYSSYVDSLGG